MNQRMGYRTSHAAMPFGQRIKGCDGSRVAQHDGNLPSFLAQGGLALSASLRLVHSGGQLAHEVHALSMRLPAGEMSCHELAALLAGGSNRKQALLNGESNQLASLGADRFGKGATFSKGRNHRRISLEQAKLATRHVGHNDDGLGTNGKHRVLQNAGIALVHGGGNRGGFVVSHGCLPSGAIPPMGESYAVTSDVSIPSRKDFLEAA